MKDKKALYIIDEHYIIQYINKAVQEYYPEQCEGMICYKAFANREEPCTDCPIMQTDNETTFFHPVLQEWINTSSVEMEWQGKEHCNAVTFRLEYMNAGITGCYCQVNSTDKTHCETVCVNKNCPLYMKRLVESQKQQMLKDEQ